MLRVPPELSLTERLLTYRTLILSEEEHEGAHPQTEPRDADRQYLGDDHGWEEGEQRGEPGRIEVEGLSGRHRGQHEDDLVGEADEEHVDRRSRVAAELVDAEVAGAQESAPAVSRRAAADAARAGNRKGGG